MEIYNIQKKGRVINKINYTEIISVRAVFFHFIYTQ